MSRFPTPRIGRALAALLVLCPSILAQATGSWSQEYDRPGLVGRVYALTTHAGTLYAGGEALWGGGAYFGGLARFDGLEWREVPGAPDGTLVGALESFGTGVVVAGDFLSVGGQAARSIASWDGTAWSTFASGLEGEVFDLAVFQGELVAAGNFTQAGGQPIVGIARWNGAQWQPVGGSAAGPISNTVWTLGLGPDGRLYAGGDFDSIGGVALRGVAAWDGVSWSPVGAFGEVIGSVKALEWYQGRLYAGGSIDFSSSTNENVVVFDGTSWSSTGGIPDWSIASTVNALEEFGGFLYAGGNFVEAGGAQAVGIARFDGSTWSAVGGAGNSSPLHNSVIALWTHAGALHVGGEIEFAGFQSGAANGVVSNSVARFDGTQWDNVGEGLGFDAEVRATTKWNGGIAAVGRFTQAGTALGGRVAWFDGLAWHYLGATNNNVNDCVVYQGDLVITGEFSAIDGQPFNAIARWNGANWSTIGSGAGGLSLAVYQGELYAGGLGGFRRWNGTSWSPLINAGLSYVRKMHVHTDGLLYVAGGAFNANARVFSYDGTSLTPLGTGVDDTVEAMTSFGGDLIVGGEFTLAGGQPANRLARWTGSSWLAFGGITGSLVRSLAVYQGELHAGGDLVAFSGHPADWIARWDGATWQPLGLGLNGTPFTLLPDDDAGRLHVGGLFTRADYTGVFGEGTPSYYFGVWQTEPAAAVPFCSGDGSAVACPCANSGGGGRGCANSQNQAGAALSASGSTNPDTLVLTALGELASSLTIFLQGDVDLSPGVPFGDGVRCTGGTLKRLYVKSAVAGAASAPGPGDLSITAQSAALGDVIPTGGTRFYQAYYRDPDPAFCPAPAGSTFNATQGLIVTW